MIWYTTNGIHNGFSWPINIRIVERPINKFVTYTHCKAWYDGIEIYEDGPWQETIEQAKLRAVKEVREVLQRGLDALKDA